ncbi:MAG TPA: hypothetical protein VJC05_00680 [Candidatus Andersenbacteria bacterium]|nr:hypothetical protein [Candidatus Andersenbacteria bacterium]
MVENSTSAILTIVLLAMLGLVAWVGFVNIGNLDLGILSDVPGLAPRERQQPARPAATLEAKPIERVRDFPVLRP